MAITTANAAIPPDIITRKAPQMRGSRGSAMRPSSSLLVPMVKTSKPAGASVVEPVPDSAVRLGITSRITLSVPGTMCGVASSWKPTLTGDSSLVARRWSQRSHSTLREQATSDIDEPGIELLGRLNSRGNVVIEVKDNGPGVPADLVNKIFVPYFTTKKNGSGVGLALARQVMTAHGGFIRVGQNEGGGATFSLIF